MRKLQRAQKAIPAFKSEAEEREFWLRADSTEYVDWDSARPMRFPNLRPSSTPEAVDAGHSLRQVGAAAGVSHERIRQVLRERAAE